MTNQTENIQTLRAEIEKGCDNLVHYKAFTAPETCGTKFANIDVGLCDSCKAKLSLLNEIEKIIQEKIDKNPRIETIESANPNITFLMNSYFDDICEALMEYKGYSKEESFDFIWDFLVHFRIIVREKLKKELGIAEDTEGAEQ